VRPPIIGWTSSRFTRRCSRVSSNGELKQGYLSESELHREKYDLIKAKIRLSEAKVAAGK
jgi:hypothetical protein